MAVRAERLEMKAAARLGKAKVMDLQHIKEFSVSLGDVRQKRDEHGKVYKIVRLLKCRARIDRGVGAIEHIAEMEASEGGDIYGELDQAISPGLREFLEVIRAAVKKKLAEPDKPIDPEQPKPLLSERPLDLDKSARMKAYNARVAAERAAAKAAEAEVATGAEPQGGEA